MARETWVALRSRSRARTGRSTSSDISRRGRAARSQPDTSGRCVISGVVGAEHSATMRRVMARALSWSKITNGLARLADRDAGAALPGLQPLPRSLENTRRTETSQQRSSDTNGNGRELQRGFANAIKDVIDGVEEPRTQAGLMALVPCRGVVKIGLPACSSKTSPPGWSCTTWTL